MTDLTVKSARARSPFAFAPFLALLALVASSFALSGCAAIGDIFKAGVWVGVVMVVGVIALVGGAAAMFRR